MIAFFAFEAGQTSRRTYRLTFGLFMPGMASMVALLSRLF